MGVTGFNSIIKAKRIGHIGYWLGEEHAGQGIMTRAVKVLTEHGFATLGLNRITIAAAVGNDKSRAVAERLGFRLEGIARDAEWLYDHFVDHAIYAVTRADWDALSATALQATERAHRAPGHKPWHVPRPTVATLHVIDAFTDTPFAGNPAAVSVSETPRDEAWMKQVAREMNLSETAFLHPVEGGWSLRWFTPTVEVTLCGHATLASAFVLWETGVLKSDEIAHFHTLSGWLACRRDGDWIEMDFPASICAPCQMPETLLDALGSEAVSAGFNGMDYLVEVADEKALRALKPDFTAISKLPMRGVIVTCRSESPNFDFISRFFAPSVGVNEDPVTGSAHCALGPWWQEKLGQSEFTAYQASERGGIVKLTMRDDRVFLRGQAVMMSKVEILAHDKS